MNRRIKPTKRDKAIVIIMALWNTTKERAEQLIETNGAVTAKYNGLMRSKMEWVDDNYQLAMRVIQKRIV